MYKSKFTKKRFGTKKRFKSSKKPVNSGYKMVRDNMVWMKRLHRGKSYMLYNYGNPTSSNVGYLRGKQIDDKRHIPKVIKKSKKQQIAKNRIRHLRGYKFDL